MLISQEHSKVRCSNLHSENLCVPSVKLKVFLFKIMSKGDTVETSGEVLQTEREQLKKEVEQLKVEKQELQTSADRWKQEVSRLRELLVDKEQLVYRALKNARGCVSHEELRKRVTQAEESHRKELLEREESFRKQLQDRDDVWWQKLSEMEETLRKKLAEEEEKFQNELLQQEELMKQKLSDEDETFQKLLAEVCHHWETSAQNWADKQKELGEMIQKNNNTWKQMEAEYNEEIQHLREKILQLQGLLQQTCLETKSKT